MSDNITREPYRNAWYKQLADAVKKHDEEIAEMTPHLVPEVEDGDNGKILIAGEDGAFDWGQPPEELPVITEDDEGKVLKVDEGVPKWLDDQDAEIPSHTASDEGKMLSVNAQNGLEWKNVPAELPTIESTDEGKVLKVNEGVPKWLEDTDSEYLMVTITSTGTSPNLVFTADKDYNTIREFALKGKCIAKWDNYYYPVTIISNNNVTFYSYMDSGKVLITKSQGTHYTSASVVSQMTIAVNIIISATSIDVIQNKFYDLTNVNINDTTTSLADAMYNLIQYYCIYNACISVNYKITANNKLYKLLSEQQPDNTKMVFANYELGLRVIVHSDKSITKESIPKLPTATSADEGKVVMVDSNGDYVLGTVQGEQYIIPYATEQATYSDNTEVPNNA